METTYGLETGTLISFLLLTTRVFAVMQYAPPFSSGAVLLRVRLAIATSIGIAMAPVLPTSFDLTMPTLVMAVVYQVVAGAAMGVIIALFMSAVQAAGTMIDVFSGIGVAVLYDPTTQVQAGPIGRLNQTIMVAMLFVVDGHLLIVRGVLRTFEAAPLDGLDIDNLPVALTRAASDLLLAAIEIALPILVALALTEAVMALASRAAPKLNVMVLGFAAKAMVMIMVLAISVPLVVRSVGVLIERAVGWSMVVVGG